MSFLRLFSTFSSPQVALLLFSPSPRLHISQSQPLSWSSHCSLLFFLVFFFLLFLSPLVVLSLFFCSFLCLFLVLIFLSSTSLSSRALFSFHRSPHVFLSHSSYYFHFLAFPLYFSCSVPWFSHLLLSLSPIFSDTSIIHLSSFRSPFLVLPILLLLFSSLAFLSYSSFLSSFLILPRAIHPSSSLSSSLVLLPCLSFLLFFIVFFPGTYSRYPSITLPLSFSCPSCFLLLFSSLFFPHFVLPPFSFLFSWCFWYSTLILPISFFMIPLLFSCSPPCLPLFLLLSSSFPGPPLSCYHPFAFLFLSFYCWSRVLLRAFSLSYFSIFPPFLVLRYPSLPHNLLQCLQDIFRLTYTSVIFVIRCW